MTNTAVATPPKAQSTAERAKERLDGFMTSLEKRNDHISTLLGDSGVNPERFLAVARRALTRDPALLECTSASLMQAFINAATDGLLPDGRKGAITYFKMKDGTKQAQWNPMVQGLMEIAYRSNQFLNIEAQVVYEGDLFEYELGDKPFIRHKRAPAVSAEGRKIVQAYAIARTVNGGIYREVMEPADLAKIRAVSRAHNGPNKDWPEEMARKAPLRRLWKYLPKTPAMDRITDHDDETYDLDAVRVAQPTSGLRDRLLGKSDAPGFNLASVQAETGGVTYTEVEDDEPSAEDDPASQKAAEPDDEPDATTRAAKAVEDADEQPQSDAGGDQVDPLEWYEGAKGYVAMAEDVPTLNALNAQWAEEGHWARLKAAHPTEWQHLVSLMETQKAEILRAEARAAAL